MIKKLPSYGTDLSDITSPVPWLVRPFLDSHVIGQTPPILGCCDWSDSSYPMGRLLKAGEVCTGQGGGGQKASSDAIGCKWQSGSIEDFLFSLGAQIQHLQYNKWSVTIAEHRAYKLPAG